MARGVGLSVVAVVLVAALVLGLVVLTFAERATPKTTGEVALAGLTAPVTIGRDGSGIPHLSGSTLTDLARAQGYVHAQDRFFDMDLRRHIATGTLSELVGAAGLPADRVVRTLGWRRVAEESLPILQPGTRRYLQAYADGVNDYLSARSTTGLALEYAVLGIEQPDYAPADWTPVDSLAWLTAMAWDLKGNYADELARARLTGRVDPSQILQLYPGYDGELNPPILSPEEWQPNASAPAGPALPEPALPDAAPAVDPSAPAGVEELYAAIGQALDAVPASAGRGEGIGSNSWVVDGSHSESGKPLLANDPHLGVRLPGIWYQNSLTCLEVTPECPLRVSGFSFPGLPGVVIGHNERIAWGLTNLGPDVADFYLERIDGAGKVLREGQFVDLTTRTETIRVAGGPSETITVRSTVHGPLVSDVLPAAADAAEHAPTFGSDESGQAFGLSLAWTGLQASRTADALLALNVATDFTSFRAALADFSVPSQNVVYADVDGHIGYQAPGMVPIRQSVAPGQPPGFWPAPGWDPAYDWTGTVPYEQLPWSLDPTDGVIVAANQEVTAASAPFLTSEWDPGYRATRIGELLAAGPERGLTVADMTRIQLDTREPIAPELVAALLAVDLGGDTFTEEARDLLRTWDHTTPARGTQAAPAAYVNAVWRQLMQLTFADEVPSDLVANGGGRYRAVMVTLLADPTNLWWDDKDTPGVAEGRDEILRRALVAARTELTRSLGKDPASWQWGDLHRWTPTHPVLGQASVPGPVRWLVNDDPVALGGGSSIVNANGWDASKGYAVNWAPSMRMVVDLGDLENSVWINQTGASGHPLSSHYTDQVADWARGHSRPWPFGRAALDAVIEDRLVLAPAP